MRKYSFAVCDDMQQNRDVISENLVSAFAEQGISAEVDKYSSGKDLLKALNSKRYDILFLDIDMPEIDGIALGHMVRDVLLLRTEIVYISGREERVFETFSVRPFGFVRKDKFRHDLSDLIRLFMDRQEKEERPSIDIGTKGSVTNIEADSITYIECVRDEQFIHMADSRDSYKIRARMNELEKKLEGTGLMRVHKGYIVNLAYVRRIERAGITLTDGTVVPVSRDRLSEVREAYLRQSRGSRIGA